MAFQQWYGQQLPGADPDGRTRQAHKAGTPPHGLGTGSHVRAQQTGRVPGPVPGDTVSGTVSHLSSGVRIHVPCVQSLDSLRAVVMGERPYGSASQIPPLGGAFAYEGGETPTATAIVAEWHRNQLPGVATMFPT